MGRHDDTSARTPGLDNAAAWIDRLNRLACASMAIVFVAAGERIPASAWLASWFIGLLVFTVVAPSVARRERAATNTRYLLSGVVLLSVYEALGQAIEAFGPPLRDGWVLWLERLVTGGRVPLFVPASLAPLVIDGLSMAYVLYFALPVVIVVTLDRQRGRREAARALFVLLVAFYLHYLLYVLVPVVGPLRTTELPPSVRAQLIAADGPVTQLIRRLIAALEWTRQDAFPSAHASIALLGAIIAHRYQLDLRRAVYLVAVAIVASTVLLGYHYIVDVLAALPVLWLAWTIARRLERQPDLGV